MPIHKKIFHFTNRPPACKKGRIHKLYASLFLLSPFTRPHTAFQGRSLSRCGVSKEEGCVYTKICFYLLISNLIVLDSLPALSIALTS